MADDELQEVRDNFYIGNFQKALQLCESTHGNNDIAQNEISAILARCCLAIPIFDRLKTMQNSEIPGQQAAALMAVIMKSKNPQQAAAAKEKLATLAGQSHDMSCAMLAAIVLAMDSSWSEAVQVTKVHPTAEMHALCVFLCLLCNQVGMAERKLAEMAGANDDTATFRLASAAVKLASGDPQEAYLTYCDLCTQYPLAEGGDSETGSVLLQTGKAVANMQRGMFGEAVEDLQRALQMSPGDVDVLVNLCSCFVHLGKNDEFNQHYAKLEQVCPAHPYVAKTQSLKSVFKQFKTSLKA